MNKIIIIGCPGSGKSTFAKKLGQIINIPIYHLDLIWNKPDQTTITREEFDNKLSEFFKEEKWILDGNYQRTLERRIIEADTIYLLDYSIDTCISGATNRVGIKRDDMPWYEDNLNDEFKERILNFSKNNLPEIYELLKKYKESKNIIIFKNREDANNYLNILKKRCNMKNLSLYVPNIEDYWYEQKLQSEPSTMSYNAGYDVSYYGYHYDTGCIDFPNERWEEVYNKRIKENRYLAYIKDNDINEYVGYVNYQYNSNNKRYECGIVIEYKYRGKGYSKQALQLLCDTAKSDGIRELYDNFEMDRGNTLNIFKDVGFEIVEEQTWKKFNKDVKGVLVRKVL